MLPIPFLSAGTALPALPGAVPVVASSTIDFAALLPTGIASLGPRQGHAEPGKQLPAIAAEQDAPAGDAAVAWIVPPLWDMMRAPVVAPAGATPIEARTIDVPSATALAPLAMAEAAASPITRSGAGAAAPLLVSTPHRLVSRDAPPTADGTPPATPLRPGETHGSATSRQLTNPELHQATQVTANAAPSIVDTRATESTYLDESRNPDATAPLLSSGAHRGGVERAAAPLLEASPRARNAKDHPSPAAFTSAPTTFHPAEGRGPVATAAMPAASPAPGLQPPPAALAPATTATGHPGEAQRPPATAPLPALSAGQEIEPPPAELTTAASTTVQPGKGRGRTTAGSSATTNREPAMQTSSLTPTSLPTTIQSGEGRGAIATVGMLAASPAEGMQSPPPATTATVHPGEAQRPPAPAPLPALGAGQGIEPSPAELTTAASTTVQPGRGQGHTAAGSSAATDREQAVQTSPLALTSATTIIRPHAGEATVASAPIPIPGLSPKTEPTPLERPAKAATTNHQDGGEGPATLGATREPSLRQNSVGGDTLAPAAPTGQPEASPRAASAKDQPTPAAAQPVATPQRPAEAPQPPRIAPAAQVFAAAIHQAVRDERRTDAPDPAIAAIASAATDLAPHAVTAAESTRHGALDMARDTWPAKMIERIEMIRDAMDAVDTSIRLIPDKLGAIDVSLKQNGDTVAVHFAAQQPETRQLLADAQPKLAELAEAKGLKLSAQLGDGAGQQQQQRAPTAPPHTTISRPGRAASNDDAATLADERIA